MFRKFYYPFSTCWQFYCSSLRIGALPSKSNRVFFRKYGKEMKNEQMLDKATDITIRPFTQKDIPQLIDIIKILSISHDCESCLQSWMKLDPNGISVAINGRDEVVGSISIVKNEDGDNGFRFGGLFFVRPEYQKQNISRMLWSSNYYQIETCNAGLNAVPGKLEIYRKSGFPIHETRFTIIEYYTTSWPLDFTFLADTPPPGINICPFQPSHLQSIFAYDFHLLGFKRTNALAYNLMEAGSKTLVALRNDGTCAGFGTVKVTCAGAVRIGPLYADGTEVANVLMRRLGEMMVDRSMAGFVFATTSENRHAIKWMDRLGVGVDMVCDRMYREKKLDVDLDKVFGQFDLNFAPF